MRLPLARLAVALLLLTPGGAGARIEGPFTGRLVDADTGEPIAGAVIVALYQRRTPGVVHPETAFHDLDETVSDADGRFRLPARELPTSTPLAHVTGPELIVFKAGYRNWHFDNVELGQHVDYGVRTRQQAEGWRRFRGTGAVIRMLKARTAEERARERSRARMFPPIPEDRAPRLRKALEDERLAIQRLR